MFLSPIILTLTILVSSCLAWFGLIQKGICSHQADRYFFVTVTNNLHQTEHVNQEKTLSCQGRWRFTFEKKSTHHPKRIVMQLDDWGLERESKR
ncbi:MAG: hypothetical protein COW01_03925 [Bdellovibrionales bacterium CG12_big_fil_rev_8_21_14_0_65_38_15]|nr:MAG: hypothetical protein COW79_13015 [Bdellovibrionales bacterium CG22_combo_CG10-13_8_21_14_all_38_13]PIQ56611.1 MAG: hypothetical protein COW01_03925 [Bdellovibrionales bacterium CG12_big_fil_rev_8_21_14_0_65_38_15]PIR31272.1 MAG: hypothetical protein COV38_01565 [Bdellovibrionales bacterium CG11_big_fil_rev_8_21_14_0_20_38_13]